MPVKKTTRKRTTKSASGAMPEPQYDEVIEETSYDEPLPTHGYDGHDHMDYGCCDTGGGQFMGTFARRIFLTLLAILLVYVIFLLGTLIRNNIQQYPFIGQAEKDERTLLVSGEGTVTVAPDVAITTVGMISRGETVADAQQQNNTVMNALIQKVKELGVAEADIQTANYNIYPVYDYTQQGQVPRGFEVSQSVTLKIRDIENASNILAAAGEAGANNVGGLQFTIDDREVYRAEARALALEQVAEKARSLAQSLGVQLGEVVAYEEYETGGDYYTGSYDRPVGLGGENAPAVESGSTDVKMVVNIRFEMK